MMIEEASSAPPSKWRKFILQMLAGGAAGAGGSLGVMWLIDAGVLGALDISQEVALLVALVYAAIGTLVGAGMVSPRVGAQMLNFEDESDLREQRRILSLSAVSMLAMGALLAMLALAAPDGPVLQPVALAVTVLAAAVLTWFGWRMMADMDELMRAVTRECGEVAYYLLLAIGGGWALLAHLGYAPALGMLDFVTLNFVVLLLASFIANGRRGLLKPR